MPRTGPRRHDAHDERGAMLVLTVVFVTVLSLMLVALANYAATGVRTSRVTGSMMLATTAGRAGIDYAVYQYAHDVWTPCTSIQTLEVPTSIALEADDLALTCAPHGVLDGHPLVVVAAQATAGGSSVTLFAVVQVSVDGNGAAVLEGQRA